MIKDNISNFYESLLLGEIAGIKKMFLEKPHIDTPLQGAIDGVHAFQKFADEQQEWLYDRNASTVIENVIETPESLVVELILHLSAEGETIDLPVAIKADLDEEHATALRIYHSTWPFDGKHQVRGPLIETVEGLEEPQVIQTYMEGLKTGDAEKVLNLFVEDGYAREPSGRDFRYEGPEKLADFYSMLDKGPIILKHCSVTSDGQAVAIEYICDAWANTQLPPQAGIAVYELAGVDKLQAARIYDDVEPPF